MVPLSGLVVFMHAHTYVCMCVAAGECACMDTSPCVCIHLCLQPCMPVHACTHTRVGKHACVHVCACTCICMMSLDHMRAQVPVCICTCVKPWMHVCILLLLLQKFRHIYRHLLYPTYFRFFYKLQFDPLLMAKIVRFYLHILGTFPGKALCYNSFKTSAYLY